MFPNLKDLQDNAASVDCDLELDNSLVVASEAPILLPSTPSTPATSNAPHAFFAFQNRDRLGLSTQGTAAQSSPSKPSLEMLRRPLPLPLSLRDKGLTRSQLLFSVGTSIDPRALRINGDDEFFLFMDMRAELQWTSFGMTASKWASATKIYNNRLEDLTKKKNAEFIRKNPRALADKLSEIEPRITDRIHKEDYYCT